MSLRVVFFTRSSRPSGAQMAWRLFQSGIKPVAILVEKRGRMVSGKNRTVPSLVHQLGFYFLWKRLGEAILIRLHYLMRRFLKDRFTDPGYLSIQEWALDHPSVPVIEVDDHNGEETRELLWRLEPDVGLLTNTRRIKKEILKIPRHGFLNLHLSALPQYAGLDSIFWALYHGEKEIGVSIHSASEEIDQGDLVLQKRIPVSRLDHEESLYQKALWLGTHLMVQALKQLEKGTLERKPQDREKTSYFSWPTAKERALFKKRHVPSPYPSPQRGEGSKGEPLFSSLSPFGGEGGGEGESQRTRILHLITRMTRGGAQENTLATVRGLQRKGYDVTLVTGPSWGKEGEILSEALEAGVEVVILPELVREIHPWKDLVSLKKLSSWLAENRYVIIHTHSSKAGFLGRLAGRLQKIPGVVHTPHGHVFHSYFHPWKEKLFLSLERKAAGWADRLIALTQRCQEEHLELGVGTREKWATIPSGVDEKRFQGPTRSKKELLDRLGAASDKKIIGFVGRLAPVKGARYFIEALPQIFEKAPPTHCIVVGDGEEKALLQKRIDELGLKEQVTFTGHQNEISGWMSLLDVLVVPSLNEGMGRVIVEGGLLAKAVVGTRVGGIPDLIEDGETGLLVNPRNPAEIAEAVTRLLRDTPLSRRLGERLQAKVRDGFTEDYMVEQIHRLYQELLREKGISINLREEKQHDEQPAQQAALSGDRPSSG